MSQQPSRSHVVACLVLAAVLPAAPGATQEDPDHERITEERRVVGVVERDGRTWRFQRGGYLGIQMVELTPDLRTHFGVDPSAGIMVGAVVDDSPAARAGLAVGDIILGIDGYPVESRGSLVRRLAPRREGDVVTLDVFRDGSRLTLDARVDLRQRPQFWLDSVSDGNRRFFWRSDDGSLAPLPPTGEGPLRIEPERFESLLGDLHERLASPDFDASMLEFRSNTEELEERIRELEKRLQKLSEQLEKLES